MPYCAQRAIKSASLSLQWCFNQLTIFTAPCHPQVLCSSGHCQGGSLPHTMPLAMIGSLAEKKASNRKWLPKGAYRQVKEESRNKQTHTKEVIPLLLQHLFHNSTNWQLNETLISFFPHCILNAKSNCCTKSNCLICVTLRWCFSFFYRYSSKNECVAFQMKNILTNKWRYLSVSTSDTTNASVVNSDRQEQSSCHSKNAQPLPSEIWEVLMSLML